MTLSIIARVAREASRYCSLVRPNSRAMSDKPVSSTAANLPEVDGASTKSESTPSCVRNDFVDGEGTEKRSRRRGGGVGCENDAYMDSYACLARCKYVDTSDERESSA